MARKVNVLNIAALMVENALSSEVVESSLFRRELEADQMERLARNDSLRWE